MNDPLASADLLHAARECWDRALLLGERHGYRNAQTTVIAPTGTIGLLMDCDTTGVEPDFALVKFKKLAGGGYFKIANQSLRPALVNLGYTPEQIHDILKYVMGTLTLARCPAHQLRKRSSSKGFTEAELDKIEAVPAGHVRALLRLQPLDARRGVLRAPGHPRSRMADARIQPAASSRLHQASRSTTPTTSSAAAAPSKARRICKDEHLPVFDCANKCGKPASGSSPSKATSA